MEGTMASSNGSAIAAPTPRRNVRRDRAFLVTIILTSFGLQGFDQESLALHRVGKGNTPAPRVSAVIFDLSLGAVGRDLRGRVFLADNAEASADHSQHGPGCWMIDDA